MRTTVKLDLGRALVVEQAPAGVRLTLQVGGVFFDAFDLTPDQAGALLFGVEQVLEAREVRASGDPVLSDDLCDAYGVPRGARRSEVAA